MRAEDEPRDLQQPRGKQYWEEKPGYIWYHRTTGIWQPVWLEPLPRIAVAELRWTPDVDRFGVALTVRLDGTPPRGWRRACSSRATGRHARLWTIAACFQAASCAATCSWTSIMLRSAGAARSSGHPIIRTSLRQSIEILDESGAVVDRVESYFGLRRIEARDGRFILNGIPIFLRLVLAQNYWPDSLLAAPDADALKREVELAQSLGFNGIRIHQKIEDPRFLYWCDKLGMLVWGEAANALCLLRSRRRDAGTRVAPSGAPRLQSSLDHHLGAAE